MNEELDKIYKEKIKDTSKHPYHFEKKENAESHILSYNPVCGDKFTLFLDWENDHVKSLHFHGFGCMLSKASTSILCEVAEGKSISEMEKISADILRQIEDENLIELEEMKVFTEHSSFKGRKDCILLSWKAINEALKNI